MKIYRTCNPTKFIGGIETQFAHKLIMTCGGGMGGSRWEEYITDLDPHDFTTEHPIECTNYLGETVFINPKYVAKMTEVKVVKVQEDITAWRNYHSGDDGRQYITTRYLECKVDESCSLVDEYKYESDKGCVISTKTISRKKH